LIDSIGFGAGVGLSDGQGLDFNLVTIYEQFAAARNQPHLQDQERPASLLLDVDVCDHHLVLSLSNL
jgi:hypothetical protein